jgi:hypothetical protein
VLLTGTKRLQDELPFLKEECYKLLAAKQVAAPSQSDFCLHLSFMDLSYLAKEEILQDI